MGYLITECRPAGKGRMEICLDGRPAFWLYAAEAGQFSFEEGTELSEKQYQHILHEIIGRRAIKRAMHLLEQQERTERQLREKLLQSGYPPEAVEDAIAYVKRYHYLDDARYARTFIQFHQGERSRKRLETDLLRRGVPKDVIADSMEQEFSSDEQEQIRRLLEKKQFSPDTADAKELRKIYGFLMRRGFQSADILSVLKTDFNA